MATFKQIGLLTAGGQPWNTNICEAKDNRFAYCSTLAIYIYEMEPTLNQFVLHSIMSEHKKTIKAIRWHPRNVDLIASSAIDCQIIIWNVASQTVDYRLEGLRSPATDLDWCPYENTIAFVLSTSPVLVWSIAEAKETSKLKECGFIRSPITCLRWNPKTISILAIGHDDGTLSVLYPQNKADKHIFGCDEWQDTPQSHAVMQIEWDPLSAEFLLLLNAGGLFRLVNPHEKIVIMTYVLPSAAARIRHFSWVKDAPGMFVSGDATAGVLRLWTVSKSTPLMSRKVKDTAFHAVKAVHPEMKKHNSTVETTRAISSTSACIGERQESECTIPPTRILSLFDDGSVGLYALKEHRWEFLKDMGHIETIFDCKFHPEDPDIMATASFDGSIKLWNILQMKPITSSPGNESIIYSISWSPGDHAYLAAASSKSGCFVWDTKSGKIIHRFLDHGSASVYAVAWNPKDGNCLASTGGDHLCIVRAIEGDNVKRYPHGGPVYGCDWNPKNRDLLATGCEDKLVRVFCTATEALSALKIFEGHSAKVFNVKWSPLKDGILCSGSDDRTVRVWDYSQDGCLTVLEGHTAPVRGLMWHMELPNILFSGSWDYSIRVWDVRTGYCIDASWDHAADVYAISCHAQRPFLLASCSRDSTVRLWNLESLQRPIYLELLTRHTVRPSIPGETGQEVDHLSLHGSYAMHLKLNERSNDRATLQNTLKTYSQIFLSPSGLANLWTLVAIVQNSTTESLPKNYKDGIIHRRHITDYTASEAQELETARLRSSFIGQAMKEEKLNQAAEQHMKVGEVERFCEIMVELGQWDKALAVAPAVSLEYWQCLSSRRADMLLHQGEESAVPYLIAAGSVEKLMDHYTSRGQFKDAFLVAQAASEGILPKQGNQLNHVIGKSMSTNGKEIHTSEKASDSFVQTAGNRLANWHLKCGQSVLAACSLLAIDDVQGAIGMLIRGNELELAFSLSSIFPDNEKALLLTAKLLALRLEAMKNFNLAIDFLKSVPGTEALLWQTCARFNASTTEINGLHQRAGFPLMANCAAEAEARCKSGNCLEAMQYYLLSECPERAVELGMTRLKDTMSSKNWTVDEVSATVDTMSTIRKDILQSRRLSKYRPTVIFASTYIGAMRAIKHHYTSVIVPLLQLACLQLTKDEIHLPIKLSLVKAELDAYIVHRVLQSEYDAEVVQHPTEQQTATWNAFQRKIGTEKNFWNVGSYVVAGSLLPSHMTKRTSVLHQTQIKGPVFLLEDDESAISLNDALMWARVNPFSPLGSCFQINPF